MNSPALLEGGAVVEIWGVYGSKYAIGFLKTLQYQQETLRNCQKHSKSTIDPRTLLDHCCLILAKLIIIQVRALKRNTLMANTTRAFERPFRC